MPKFPLKKLFKKNFFNFKAFSLIELSVVIMILSVVTAGFLSTSVSNVNNQRVRSANENIPIIYKALGKYLLTNKKLPCPASLKEIRTSSSTYGSAASAADCVAAGVYKSTSSINLVYGMVPIKDLQLDSKIAEDAYGNKLVYVIDKRLTRTDVSLNSFEDNVSNGTIITINSNGSNVTTAALFVIMSRGANSGGAFNANSATATPADASDSSNDATSPNDGVSPPTSSFDSTFVSSSTNSAFDDIVFYKTRDQIFDELNLWNLLPCAAGAAETLYCGTNFTWPKAYYGQLVSANQSCPDDWNSPQARPTKRCEKKGVWSSIVDPCSSSDAGAASCWVGYCTTKADYGGNSRDPYYTAPSKMASGTVLNLRCDSGYGKQLIGSYRVLQSQEKDVCTVQNDGTYGFGTLDRISEGPSVTCNSGTWSSVTYPCSACRSCTNHNNAASWVQYTEVEWGAARNTGVCYGQYRTGSGFPGNYDCYGPAGVACGGSTHLWTASSTTHLAADQNACQYQEHGNDSCGNMKARCLDGRFYFLVNCTGNPSCGNGYNNWWGSSCANGAPSFGTLVNYDGTNCTSGTVTNPYNLKTSYDKNMNGCNRSRTLSANFNPSCVGSMASNQSVVCQQSDTDSVSDGFGCSHNWYQNTYYTVKCIDGVKALTASSCTGSCG